ncbi:MAG: hypothetical protein BAJALOKI2v1_750003 [Promethearchaeota archaeon]|nr:MAG: hypothetical protein BAJALOKI2v1_750003 [Candidatus Lokiarchaeota archaeon]
MARKKKQKSETLGWDAEDKDEALEAEGLKRTEKDDKTVELVDRDSSTPVIETYDEDTGELEGSILLKDGNREGLLALVKIIEEVNVEQDHEGNISSIGFAGNLNIENPSTKDRIWDIDVSLKGIESTDLETDQIKIRELGTDEENNIDSREFQITGEAKNQLLIKEYINTLPDADNILNRKDIENDLERVREQAQEDATISKIEDEKEEIEEEEEEDLEELEDDEGDYEEGEFEEDLEDEEEDLEDEEEEEEEEEDGGFWGDGGTAIEESSLESFAISIDQENVVTFAIAMKSYFEGSIGNMRVMKTIPPEFEDLSIEDTSIGEANRDGDQLIWEIEELRPQELALLKFTCTITTSSKDIIKTGEIDVSYQASSSFAEGLGIEKFDAYTRNRFYVDKIERDEEPNVFDCKLVFHNTSEFIIQLFNADVTPLDDESTKFVDIDPNDVPLLPSEAQWHSNVWKYESEEIPRFRRFLEFRVMPDFQTIVNGALAISDVELSVASITGEMSYSTVEVPTFKEKDVETTLKVENNGSAPLNQVSIQHTNFGEEFTPPEADEIKLSWDGEEVELSPEAVSFNDGILSIELKNLRDTDTGMFEPESVLEFTYPIHSMNPPRDTQFESEVIYLANTYPPSQELEYRPEVPIIEALHLRRKFRIGKEVLPIGALGNYQIILTVENIGNTTLDNLVLMDKVPEKFEYGEYKPEELQPEITDEVGEDTLKWTIDALEQGEKLEISYEITGTGEYHASEAQLGL